MRTTPLLALAAAGLLAAAGCEDPTMERGATSMKENVKQAGQALDDAAITTRVKTALMSEENVDGGEISVSTREGRVTLSGAVPEAQIPRAEAVARKVEGVRAVDNQLRPSRAAS